MNLGFPEMLFLGLLALLLFGPRRLPEIGRQIGKALGEFKRASSEFQNQLEDEVRQLEVQEDSKHSIAPPAPEGSIAQTTAAAPASSPPLPASSNRSDAANGDPGTNRGNGAQGA
jgi:sec-independent protein translocase protein TatB